MLRRSKLRPPAAINSRATIGFWPPTFAETRRKTGYPSGLVLQNVSQERHGGRVAVIRALTVAAAILALLAGPVHAQARRPHDDGQKKTEKKPAVDDKAYKAALERIPEPKEKYDPWAVTKPAEPAKKPK
jgi:hypothetical protein